MNYWLMKSEPSAYSIEDLQNAPQKTCFWDGVRNYQARNFMRDQMKKGDLAFFYHSNAKPTGIAGVVKIVGEGHPDVTAFDSTSSYYDEKSSPENPRWFGVDVKLQKVFSRIITLAELKTHAPLKDMKLLQKGQRLSVMPVSEKEFLYISDL